MCGAPSATSLSEVTEVKTPCPWGGRWTSPLTSPGAKFPLAMTARHSSISQTLQCDKMWILELRKHFFDVGRSTFLLFFLGGGWDWEYKTEVTEDGTLSWGQDGLVSRWGPWPLKHKMPSRGCCFILQIRPKCPSVALCLQYENLSQSDPYPYFR